MIGNPYLDPKIIAREAGLDLEKSFVEPTLITKDDIRSYEGFFMPETLSIWNTYFSRDDIPWEYRLKRTISNETLFVHSIKEDPWTNVLLQQLEDITGLTLTDPRYIVDVRLTGQLAGQDDIRHTDNSQLYPWWTVVFFPLAWDESWGGELEIFRSNGEPLKTFPLKQGTVICLPGNILKREIPPSVKNKMKVSLSVLTRINFDDQQPRIYPKKDADPS
jgi:hypothetical protein